MQSTHELARQTIDAVLGRPVADDGLIMTDKPRDGRASARRAY
jgi:hypothetical protein